MTEPMFCYRHERKRSVGQMFDEVSGLTVEVCDGCRKILRGRVGFVDVTGSKYRSKPAQGMFRQSGG